MSYLLILVTLAGSLGSWYAYYLGQEHGANKQINTQMERRLLAIQTRDEALKVAADAIKEIKIENTTVVQKFREVEKQRTVYSECRHDDDTLKLFNTQLQAPARK